MHHSNIALRLESRTLQYCLETAIDGSCNIALLLKAVDGHCDIAWECSRCKLRYCLEAAVMMFRECNRWTLQWCLETATDGSCNVAWGCNRWKSQYCLEIGVTGHCNIALRLQQMEVAILPWDRSRWTLHRCFGAAVDGSYNDASE